MALRSEIPPQGDAQGIPLNPGDKKAIKQEFARRLYAQMVKLNFNQSELGRQADIGRDSISNYINADSLPGPANLDKLAKALKCRREDLLPDAVRDAAENQPAPVDFRVLPNNPQRAWLRVNKEVSFAVAAKVVALLSEEDP